MVGCDLSRSASLTVPALTRLHCRWSRWSAEVRKASADRTPRLVQTQAAVAGKYRNAHILNELLDRYVSVTVLALCASERSQLRLSLGVETWRLTWK